MYKIIGADGAEYGPVTSEQLREWIAEGRADAQTRVWAEGWEQWKLLGDLPEFANAPGMARPSQPEPMPTPVYAWQPPRTNPLATTSFICGLIAITFGVCCCYGLPFNLLGTIFAIVALSQIKADPQREQGRGLAIAGLVLSVLSFALAGLGMLLGLAANHSHFFRGLGRW
jgi:hypothetical protein